MTDWNAARYHEISAPQQAWGRRVLERLPLTGTERVLDLGCGTGTPHGGDRRRAAGGLRWSASIGRTRCWSRPRTWLRDAIAANRGSCRPTRGAAVPPRVRRGVQRRDVSLGPRSRGVVPLDRHRAASRADAWSRSAAAAEPRDPLCGARRSAACSEPRFARYFEEWTEPDVFRGRRDDAAPAGYGRVRGRRRVARRGADPVRRPRSIPGIRRERLPAAPRRAACRARNGSRSSRDLTVAAAADDPPFTLDYWRLNIAGTASRMTLRHRAWYRARIAHWTAMRDAADRRGTIVSRLRLAIVPRRRRASVVGCGRRRQIVFGAGGRRRRAGRVRRPRLPSRAHHRPGASAPRRRSR